MFLLTTATKYYAPDTLYRFAKR